VRASLVQRQRIGPDYTRTAGLGASLMRVAPDRGPVFDLWADSTDRAAGVSNLRGGGIESIAGPEGVLLCYRDPRGGHDQGARPRAPEGVGFQVQRPSLHQSGDGY
jgi:hypothetical protein